MGVVTMVLLLSTSSVAVAKLAVAKPACTCPHYPHSAGYLTRRTIFSPLCSSILVYCVSRCSLDSFCPLFSGRSRSRRRKLPYRCARNPRSAASRAPCCPARVAGRLSAPRIPLVAVSPAVLPAAGQVARLPPHPKAPGPAAAAAAAGASLPPLRPESGPVVRV